jgi:alanine dehydrogenase
VRIGVPKEIKDGENRVALTPAGVRTLRGHGHEIFVERGAGAESGISDEEFSRAGAQMKGSAQGVYEAAELCLKVKEPLPQEYEYLRPGLILFTYLHLASSLELTLKLIEKRVAAIGYETVQKDDATLPLLIPMSEIAGRLAIQLGARYLEKGQGGRGILLGGVPGVPPSEVVILGCGVVGVNAAKMAVGMGAHVTILDIDHERLRYLDDVMHGNIITVYSNPYTIERSSGYADLFVGAVLRPGARAPILLTEQMVKNMKPCAVVVDVSVDQGGCVETIHPTSHSDPVYVEHGVIHYGVPNMPAAVPRSATFALTNATLPYVSELAELGFEDAVKRDAALARGVNVARGKVVHEGVAEAFGLPHEPL